MQRKAFDSNLHNFSSSSNDLFCCKTKGFRYLGILKDTSRDELLENWIYFDDEVVASGI